MRDSQSKQALPKLTKELCEQAVSCSGGAREARLTDRLMTTLGWLMDFAPRFALFFRQKLVSATFYPSFLLYFLVPADNTHKNKCFAVLKLFIDENVFYVHETNLRSQS